MKYVLILRTAPRMSPIPIWRTDAPRGGSYPAHGLDRGQWRIGTVKTVPKGFTPGSDVATLSVVGYSPEKYYTGRAPLEAAARRIPIGTDDLVFRCNLVTIVDGCMVDFSAGHISQPEAAQFDRRASGEAG